MKSLFFPCCLILALFFNSCSDNQEKVKIDPAFGQFVSAYSSGVISVTEPISIRLTQDYPKGNILPEDLIEFEPEIEGVLELTGSRVLTFYPAEKLKGGTVYTAELDLPELFPEAGNLGEFTFQFETIQQNLSIYFDGYKMDDPNGISQVVVSGILRTADVYSLEELKNSVKAFQEEEELLLQLNELTNREFSFDILGAKRIEEKSSVNIEVDEKLFPSSNIENQKLEIPSISDFNVMSVKFLNGNEDHIEILFSDPLQMQDLAGLITVEGIADDDLNIKQSKNKVEVLLTGRLQGEKLVKVYADVKNIAGREMGESFTKTLVFDPEDPAIRMVSKKFVLPSQSDGLLFPFEAVSLNSVDIFITKVFSNNLLQYLQNNNQGDGNSLYYVGRTVYKKHLDLRKVGSGKIHEWHRYQVDLSDVINLDRAALYQVEVRFKREYAALDCIEEESIEGSSFNNGWIKDDDEVEQDYWAGYSYNWEERDNPCSPSYYYRYRSKSSRVVMATNLGVIAKSGGDNLLHVVTTDLQSTNPVSGASIEVYDYQQQLIGEGKSDAEGFATIECSRAPLAVMVKTSDDQTILKVNDGNSLSLSKFDVEGRVIRDGLKGFIYTERGVWRPGDSIFVDFILRDVSEKLPKGHPVKLEFYNSRGQLTDTKINTNSLNGFHQFTLSTSQDDPTGDYRVKISVGNQKFTKRIPVETIKPNRLKIDLELDEIASTSERLWAELSAKWLHGVIASGLKADIHMRLSPTRTSFDKFRGYHFDNLLESRVSRANEKVFDGTLEDDGTKSVSISLEDRGNNAPGMLRAYFETKVYEPGGGFSVDYYNTLVSPYDSYVGVKVPEGTLWGDALEVDKTHSIQLAGINEDGKVPESREVEVSIFKIDRRWWFDRYSGDEYNYLNTSSYRKTKNETVTLQKGKGSIDVNIPKESWGRYLIRVEDL
ncbi:MAG: MG2 domain-containing protein, partial [Bacteroidota bacterium]